MNINKNKINSKWKGNKQVMLCGTGDAIQH